MNRFIASLSSRMKKRLVAVFFALVLSVLFYCFLRFAGRCPEEPTFVIYAYSDMLSHDVFIPFEKEKGIKIQVKHFEAVEELLTMFLFMKESVCDLIIPTDAMVETLIKERLLQPIDKAKLSCFSAIDHRLLGKYYDRSNTYVVPFSWSPIGIAYDSQLVTTPPEEIGWDIVFGKQGPANFWLSPADLYGSLVRSVCMGDDPWETLFLASLYLFDTIDGITPERQEEIVALLRRQRGWLESYTNNVRYFILSGVSPVVVMPAAHALAAHAHRPAIDFVIPQEGSLLVIAEMAIPTFTGQHDLAHEVIDYLLSQEASLDCFKQHQYTPSNRLTYPELPEFVRKHNFFSPYYVDIRSLSLAHNQLPLQAVSRLWQRIKA